MASLSILLETADGDVVIKPRGKIDGGYPGVLKETERKPGLNGNLWYGICSPDRQLRSLYHIQQEAAVIPMIPQPEDRRSCVRGNFPYQVKFRLIIPGEAKTIHAGDDLNAMLGMKKLKLGRANTDSKDIGMPQDSGFLEFLLQMDEKLDRILALLSEREEQDRDFMTGIGVNISASGMSFMTEHPVDLQQMVRANITLSKIPFVGMDVIGRIVRVTSMYAPEPVRYEIGVEFVDLNAEDRERIVACVFQRERELIRRNKENEGERN